MEDGDPSAGPLAGTQSALQAVWALVSKRVDRWYTKRQPKKDSRFGMVEFIRLNNSLHEDFMGCFCLKVRHLNLVDEKNERLLPGKNLPEACGIDAVVCRAATLGQVARWRCGRSALPID
jgi:hypothetical protein